MAKNRQLQHHQQLELRILADLKNSATETRTASVNAKRASTSDNRMRREVEASDSDKAVYDSIYKNYFAR